VPKKKKKELPSHIRKAIDAGLADAKAGRIVDCPVEGIITPKGESVVTRAEVDIPIAIDFFNDSRKPINIRTTPWTHAKNPEVILPLESKKIYIQQGFLKLWDNGDHFQLLVE
jgi:hypothetical protein